MHKNHEFGFVSENAEVIDRCRHYFDVLWARAGSDLQENRLSEWQKEIENHLASGAHPSTSSGLGDEGTDVGFPVEESISQGWVGEASQTFVKFFGESHKRAAVSELVLDEVRRSGCHWACTYPRGKRPRKLKDGAMVYMGRLVGKPADVLIYGQAIGMQHKPGRDDATPTDLQLRPWKSNFPHYVRVHHAEFLSGSLSNGISLNRLMKELKSDSFTSTQRNAAHGFGNTNPRNAYRQQASVELTSQAAVWLNQRFETACRKHGKLSPAELDMLDWPIKN